MNKNTLDNSGNERFTDNPNTTHDMFKELTQGYTYSFKEKDDRGCFTGGSEKRYINMDEKRECSYQKTNVQGRHQKTVLLNRESDEQSEEKKTLLGDDDLTNKDGPIFSTGKGILDEAQKWGITLRQIRAIMKNIERRCAEEKWTDNEGNALTPEIVCMYDIMENIIMPFTEQSQKSFVETLPSTKGPQLPRHYLSYTWRAPFKEIVVTLEQFVEDFSRNHNRISDNQGGGMTDDTPIHISVFAINQWDLKKEPGGLLPFSEFSHGIAQILKLVNYRLITHLDQEGAILERVWPIYDIFVTLMKSGGAGLWKIYITHERNDGDRNERNAVGLVPGGAPSDKYPNDTVLREKNFPIHLIERYIEYEVKNVQASSANDPKSFLNFLIDEDMDLDRVPPTEHIRYTEFQNEFRANFSTPGTLQAALSHGDTHWKRMLNVMSKSNAPIDLRFDFESGKGWDDLTDIQAKELIRSLPKTTLRLKIFHASYGASFVKELSDWIKATTNLKTLRIEDTLISCGIIDSQHKILQELAKSLASIDGLERLEVWNTKLQQTHTFVEMVETLIHNKKVAKALFIKPFKSLYAEDNPDFNKIKSLQTAFVSTEQRFCDLPWQIKHDTVDWAQDLSESDKTDLLQSRAGPFLKTILNKRFSDKVNLSYITLNVILQIVIVILLSNYADNIERANGISNATIFCIVWLCIIEGTQLCISTVKEYISEVQNWVDLAQIVLLTLMTDVSNSILRSDYLESAIFVSYVALIFSLGTIFFPLAQFVDALIEITKVLGPFLLTTVLIVLAFANMFHVRYSDVECPINENEFEDADEVSFIRNWACNDSAFESFKRMLYMFLTDGNWYFDHKRSEILMATFAFVIGILLLNIVIAVVSNKFTDVQNDAEKVFWVRRLSLIKEVESLRTFAKKLFHVNDPDNNDRDYRGTVFNTIMAKRSKKGRKKRFSFNFIPLDDDYAEPDDITLFFGWWFSPAEWGVTPPLPIRLRMFYLYSNWEDIVLPGKAFERILSSCSYKEDLEKYVTVIYFVKAAMVRPLTWVALFIHSLCFLAIFVVGFASFGLLWPRPLIEWLFNRGMGMEKKSESNTLIVKSYIEELSTKVDALTGLVNDTEEESNSFPTEEKNKMDTFVEQFNAYVNTQTSKLVKVNTAVEEINTNVAAVEELSVNIDAQTSDIIKMNTVVGELSAKVDAQASSAVKTNTVVGELSGKFGVLTSDVGQLSAKIGLLTSNSDQMNTVVGELSEKVDAQTTNADKMNSVVGELITKVDTLTTLIEKLLEQNATPAPAPEPGSSPPSQAHSSSYRHTSNWR